jgi:hypothetical protein
MEDRGQMADDRGETALTARDSVFTTEFAEDAEKARNS